MTEINTRNRLEFVMVRTAIETHQRAKRALDEGARNNVSDEEFARLNREVIDAEKELPPWKR